MTEHTSTDAELKEKMAYAEKIINASKSLLAEGGFQFETRGLIATTLANARDDFNEARDALLRRAGETK